MQKRAIAVHDISCVGRCSLTVALPILSAAGLNTAVVPTALLSTHTGEFTGYTHLDLTSQLAPIAQHLATLGLHYDTFYSGYLANGAQADEVLHMMDLLCDEETHIFVDPAFGDQGRMYSLMDESMPSQMRRLCSRARTIVPNITEAALLTGIPYRETADKAYLNDLLQGLLCLGPKAVCITGIEKGDTVGYYGIADGDIFEGFSIKQTPSHGTGDLFAAVFTGAVMQGKTIPQAAALAADFIGHILSENTNSSPFGVEFEPHLPYLWKLLQK